MNRTERLFATITVLQARRRVRATELAAHFEISTRTVFRDIQALCESGVPILCERGKGYSLVEGYFLPPLLFSPDQAMIMMKRGFRVQRRV